MGVDLCRVIQLWLNLLGELFAQFDSDKAKRWERGERRERDRVKYFLSLFGQICIFCRQFPNLEEKKKMHSPPLVKTVDLPHDTLHKDLVLIHCCKTGGNKPYNMYRWVINKNIHCLIIKENIVLSH